MNAFDMNRKKLPMSDWRTALQGIEEQIESSGHECDVTGSFVSANLDLLQDLGFFALGVPAELGGGGASYLEVAAMLRAVGRLDGSTALALSMHSHQVMVAEWKRRVQSASTEGALRKVAEDGIRIVSSGGSDWLAGSGRAEKVAGGYRIYARKVFASGAPDGDVMNTSAVYDDEKTGPLVLHFSLPLKAPGVTIMTNWDTLGMRGTGSHDVQIDGVFIPDAAIAAIRSPGKWHPLFHLISMIAFPLVYSVYAGVADKAREIALTLAGKHAHNDLVVLGVGEMENTHAAMNLAITAMTEMGATAMPSPETTNQIMILRGLVARFAMETGSKALDVAGGAGFFTKSGLERRFRDLQAARFHPLQDRQQQVYAGRVALGLGVDG
jgi:acyl-CoA dehydrogenase